MISEKSAGAVVFRKGNGVIFYLLLDYGKHWDFPKGHIEKVEDEKDTVRREVAEETGIKDLIFVDGFRETIKYFYKRENVMRAKTVIMYLAETKTKDVKISFEHQGFEWLKFAETLERVTFANSKEVLKKADDFLTGKTGLGKFLK